MDLRQINQLVFVPLDGALPPELHLPDLPMANDVFSSVRGAFEAYLGGEAFSCCCADLPRLPVPPDSGWTLLYVYGHAWLASEGYETAIFEDGVSRRIDAATLLKILASATDPTSTVLIVDTCHAARLLQHIGFSNPIRLVVAACGSEESAIALPVDRTTRLAVSLYHSLRAQRTRHFDFVRVVMGARDRLMRDSVVIGQTVDYALNGQSVWLQRTHRRARPVAHRTTQLVVGALAVSFLLVGIALTWAAWFYSQHAMVELNVGNLSTLIVRGNVVVYRQVPERNASVEVRRTRINAKRVRLWVPADDIVIRVEADFHDGAARTLAFPLQVPATVRLRQKLVSLTLPPTTEVKLHPDMAYIPVRELRAAGMLAAPPSPIVNVDDPNLACASEVEGQVVAPGLEPPSTLCATPRVPELAGLGESYWIDLAPPTVAEYTALAAAMVKAQRVQQDQVLIFMMDDSSETQFGALPQLTRALSVAIARVGVTRLPHPAGQSSLLYPSFAKPCTSCPAPMGNAEAQNYCAARGARLPTFDEWLLATGGIDARIYPWGNRFDPTLAHVPGLPSEVGKPNTLLPVLASGAGVSPFGLIDTVGNAGDWVDTPGEIPSMFVGGTYHGNPEDATIRSNLPGVSGPNEMLYEITARCVQAAK